jgi:hypothetical protein
MKQNELAWLTALTFPVESVEPLVLLNVPDAALLVTQPLGTVIPDTTNSTSNTKIIKNREDHKKHLYAFHPSDSGIIYWSVHRGGKRQIPSSSFPKKIYSSSQIHSP